MSQEVSEDLVFSALADKNRRQVIELLRSEEKTIQELHDSFDFSFQALSKHIRILEEAQVLRKRKHGKFVYCSLNHIALQGPMKWISYHSSFWNDSFDQLGEIIRRQKGDEK